MSHSSSSQLPSDLPRRFESTRWSIVADARRGTPARSRAALEELCRAYWYPIYSFVRRKGLPPESARDITQSFFVRVLERDFFDAATPERGRLRSFLLKSVQNHLISHQRAAAAQKRAPQAMLISLDQLEPERRFQLEPADPQTAERSFERQWALTLIERAMDRLRTELTDKLGPQSAARLIQLLTGEAEGMSLAAVAEELQTSDAAMKVRMHRIRGRYRQLLRMEVADTVSENVDVDEELKNLLDAL
ncbi:RNA polymerase sigma factor [Roseimaritima ulvae]|uniref:RNA polymerase sigma factor n=1 Tax=Roseimaritima ulvae TaxID=980254 RepID=A0A5B9QZV0_9BACT|nr:sigma-70 family RNA polymerase sigma factor [Roseimaritima ulvae]QEG43460.1 RNA polymerase sigma factor [Roseimaritima ulvae]